MSGGGGGAAWKAASASTALLVALLVHVAAPQQLYYQQQFANDNPHCCDEYCYDTDNTPYIYLSTKTAYEFIYGRNSRQHVVPQCRPLQMWSLNRHGTRLPGRDSIIKMSSQLPKLKQEIIYNYEESKSYPNRGRLCTEDLAKLKRWRWNQNITLEHANWLTESGREDIKYLAKRYKTRFSALLDRPYTPEDFEFIYENTERLESSYKAYVGGLFGGNSYQVQPTIVLANESIISPYENCKAFDDAKAAAESQDGELYKFTQTTEYQDMLKNVSSRLGYRFVLNDSAIHLMYDMCRFEKAWDVKGSAPWCAAFTKYHLQLLEYYYDLSSYYTSGYGNDLSAKIGCVAVKEFLEYFEDVAKGDTNQPKAIVYFTHSKTVELFLVALGFQKDLYALQADDFGAVGKRQWRTSKITPFSANLAIVFYECDNGDKHVMFFLNESPIEFPDCRVGLCPWQAVYDRLKPIADNCNLQEACTRAAASNTYAMSIGSLILLFITAKLFS